MGSICYMTKHLKIGLICMLAAVVLIPIAALLKFYHVALPSGLIPVVMASMLLEVIGLIFVIIDFIHKRKSN